MRLISLEGQTVILPGLSTFENCLAWGTKTWKKKYFNILQFFLRLRPSNCVSVLTLRKSDKQKKKKVMFSLMREILHAWRDVSHSCGRFYILGVRAWEIVSRHETHAQCVRADSPDFAVNLFYRYQESFSHTKKIDTIVHSKDMRKTKLTF